ncbi:SAM-dependent methyltransferase [Alicyclobacillus ferrooxydans]|uniref:SAM-dependent methyltransferase n=1 Tax=Alicyclobacillus ferrooxydans TaxID=471514 RepID=A0A0P9F1P5_9BACL|nr:SAM-dependent methyltransferase [Alicyclobacillus ferrooxydans]KPV45302.1 hypothetical protein AN477_02755 [Alicyclobacillus ferrooxydans]
MSSFGSKKDNDDTEVNRIWDRLRAAGNERGWISFGKYMDLALYGPEGYYQRVVRLGGAGSDFYTAAQFPLFGMTIGRYISQRWQERAMPDDVLHIVELGPGQGELAYQVCSYLIHEQIVHGPIQYTFVERSKYLSCAQREKVHPLRERIQFGWIDPTEAASSEGFKSPEGFSISGEIVTGRRHAFVISNELLDALPVERIRRTKDGFLQSYIRVKDGENELLESFLKADEPLVSLAECYAPVPEGQAAEICLQYPDIFQFCASLADEVDGLFFDYGTYRDEWAAGIRPSGTLRAYRNHQLVDPLSQPGFADLTADVNWDLAADAARKAGFTVREISGQGSFLMKNGIMDVAAKLVANPQLAPIPSSGQHPSDVPSERHNPGANTLSATAVVSGAIKQLVLPGGMGDRFSAFVFVKQRGDGEQLC